MAIPLESFEVQVESPVDFASLKRNGINLDALMGAQQLSAYFSMLNGPTYVKLVKDFWVRAEVYDLDAAKTEENQAVARDPSLKDKTRKEMGLEPFRKTEIRSAVMGIPITITKEVIARACRVAPEGKFLWNVNRKHPLLEMFTTQVLKGNPATKLVEIDDNHRMLLKFITDCFFQKGGGSDRPSLDHKLVLYFPAAYEKINLPRYLMHHLCWAIKEGIRGKRKQIPCGRLLSEIFTQGKLLETLRRHRPASDRSLKTVTGKIINVKTLQNMKIIRKFAPSEKDMKEFAVQTELMRDFPPISKEDNPEVLAELIATYAKESGGIILDKDTPDIPDEAPLRVRGKRAKIDDHSEVAGVQTKKQKLDKSEATNYDSMPAPTPKRKRGKGESSINAEVAKLALEEMEAEEPRPKKTQITGTEIVPPMFVMSLEMARRSDEHAAKLLQEKKKKKEHYLAEREEKLKSLGLDSCDDFYVQKLAEVKAIAGEVEQEAVKKAQEMLEKIQETSEVGASEDIPESAAPESASEAEKSKASGNPSDLNSAKIIQILDSPTIISPPLSPINDSDHDDMPLCQRKNMLPKPSQKPKPFQQKYPAILQSIGEMSQIRVDVCNRLPADHPFQPPVIEPLNMIPANNLKPSQTTQQTPLQKGQFSATAEGSEDPEEPNTTDLPHCDSPSNLFSLERHLGGELMETPQKATKSVPKKIDLVNQQPPKPTQQNNPEPSSIQTQT